jgi:hypothetical protein
MIQIRAFRPCDEPEICLDYIEGHRRVLEDYGIINITSYNKEWLNNPHIAGVIAELDGKMVGGIRVQTADGIHPLPVEAAVGKMDPKVHDLVTRYRLDGGSGELCGLWNAKNVAGRGISMLLVRAAISIINQLKFRTLLGICGPYSLDMFKRVGFEIDYSLGDGGNFIYPTPEYIAYVLGILNAETLDSSLPYDREKMLDLRKNPDQIRIETGPKDDMEVNYLLTVPNIKTTPSSVQLIRYLL